MAAELTADELRTQIQQEDDAATQLTASLQNEKRELSEAKARQALRRELEARVAVTANRRSTLDHYQQFRSNINADRVGELPGSAMAFGWQPPKRDKDIEKRKKLAKSTLTYDTGIYEREFVWELAGLSWLPCALQHESREATSSEVFEVTSDDSESRFLLAFSPDGAMLVDGAFYRHQTDFFESNIEEGTCGTLALIRKKSHYGVTLDVTFFVRAASGSRSGASRGASRTRPTRRRRMARAAWWGPTLRRRPRVSSASPSPSCCVASTWPTTRSPSRWSSRRS